ncbi:MAG: 1-acyl-sn-glycerol-3-phosphate acyltransferase [Oscillospiraceae bacterium]|nr:1-acyl-sn-glycerol-3-phosphate acyltransferase [Oscillospiraceae bacterium]
MNRLLLMVLRNIFRVPGLYGKLCHYAKYTNKYPEEEKWNHIAKIMKYAVKSGNLNFICTGTENVLAAGQGFMMYGNHQGLFDIVAIAATCPVPLGAVLKKELVGIPLIDQIKDCTKSFPMDREDVRQSLTVIQNVIAEVKTGRNYLIFPEGTRSKNGNIMGEFHGGSFRPAVKTKCPIVPVCFIDSFKVLDQKGSKPLTVQIHYLEPIPYEAYEGMKATEVAALVKEKIQACIDANLGREE